MKALWHKLRGHRVKTIWRPIDRDELVFAAVIYGHDDKGMFYRAGHYCCTCRRRIQ